MSVSSSLIPSFFVVAFLTAAGMQAHAAQVYVAAGNANDLMLQAAQAKAGDTIWVPAGEYDLTGKKTYDPGNRDAGWGKGLLWLGRNNGTPEKPIVLAGSDPANPPDIHGTMSEGNEVLHIENDYVILKNLKLSQSGVGIVLDNAHHVLIEDCDISNTRQELVHMRDSSTFVNIRRNFIHNSGNVKGTYGEGIYVGTDHAAWGVDGEPNSLWGEQAKTDKSNNRFTYYDWRVSRTTIKCNLFQDISAENVDIKEGASYTTISQNMLTADGLQSKPEPRDCDNSFIEVKGTHAVVAGNYMYTANNPKLTGYIDEDSRTYTGNVPAELTADKSNKFWCDESKTDGNVCSMGDNIFIDHVAEVRNLCKELFTIPGKPITYKSEYPNAEPYPWSASSHFEEYEAEDATLTELAEGYSENPAKIGTDENASGGKYVAMQNGNLRFTVRGGGRYTLMFGYNFLSDKDTAYKEQNVSVNGITLNPVRFLRTGPAGSSPVWNTTSTSIRVEGETTIDITRGWGFLDLDYIKILGSQTPVIAMDEFEKWPADEGSTSIGKRRTGTRERVNGAVGAPYQARFFDLLGRSVKR